METDAVVERLEQRGIKPTANRILVCRALMRARHPMSMADLEDSLLTLDKSTIFRSLTLFLSHDLVHAIEDGSGSLKYELCHGEHHHTPHDQHIHFHCTSCNRTFCLNDVPIPQVSLPEGFVLHDVNYVIKGVCQDCSRKR